MAPIRLLIFCGRFNQRGRQGLVEAQGFPLDYSGISVGQPPLNETYLGAVMFNWLVRQNFDADGNPILSAEPNSFGTL